VELAQKTFLLRFYKVIGYNLARYQVLYLRLAGSNSESVHGHLEVVDLLENGDYDLAKTMLKTHVERTHEILNESIKNQSELLNHAQPA
jgi:DNA-binding GntR family transcriptional regulator